MHPAQTPLHLIPGTTHRSTLRIMQPTWVYKPVTSITAGAPVQLQVVAYGLNAALALQEHIGSGGPAHALATAEAPGFISPAHLQLLDHLGRVNDIGRPGHVGFGVGAAGPDRAAPGRPACGCGAPVEAESPQEERARLPAPPFHRDAPYGSSISLA